MPHGVKSKTTRQCVMCGAEKSISDFFETFSITPQYENRMPVCRSCTRRRFDTYALQFNQKASLYLLCIEQGIPYKEELAVEALEHYNNPTTTISKQQHSVFLEYHKLYYKAVKQDNGELWDGVWDSDRTFAEVAWPEKIVEPEPEIVYQTIKVRINENGEEEVIEEDDDDEDEVIHFTKKELKQLKFDWGDFTDDPDAYPYLIQKFEEYVKDLDDMDTTKISRYRSLCKSEYQEIKAYEGGDTQEIAKAQANTQSLLKLLKLDNFTPVEKDITEKFIDRLAWTVEETEPCEEEDKEKYKDIAGFEKSFNGFMRSMQNILSGSRQYPDIPKNVGG